MKKLLRNTIDYFKAMLTATPPTGEVATRDLDMLYKALGILPNPDPILRKAGKTIEVYTELLSDDQVGACIESLEMAVIKKKWVLSDNGANAAAMEFAEQAMDTWDLDAIMSESIMARAMGYQPFEMYWDVRDGQWVIDQLVGKPAKWFRYGDQGELLIKRAAGAMVFDPVPVNKFIVARHRPTYDNPYGRASLARCFWPVAFKKGGLKFWLKFIEKYGTPWVIGKQPRGASKPATDQFLDQLDAMVQDAVAVIPDDSSVEIMEAGGKGGSSELFDRFVSRNDSAIAKALLSQTLTTDGGNGTGSYALGKVHDEVRDDVVDGCFKLFKFVIDQALELQHQYNFDGPAPTITAIEDEDVQKDRAERDSTLSKTGVKFTPKYFQKAYNLAEEDFHIGNATPEPPQEFSARCTCPACRKRDRFNEQALPLWQQEFESFLSSFAEGVDDSLNGMVQPALDLLGGVTTYEQAIEGLTELWPELDTNTLAERLQRAIFVCDLWGRLSPRNERETPNN